MLQSYIAEINGTQLTWLDQTPPNLVHRRVVVVVETPAVNTNGEPTGKYQLADLSGRLQWQGDAVLAQRAQRDAW